MNLLQRVFKASSGFPAVAEPLNKDGQVAPADLRDPPEREASADEGATVEHVLNSFQEAARARMPLERDWVLSVAMTEGRQWLGWDDATHRAINLMDENEQDRYVTDPLLEPLLMKWASLVTMTKPDASTAPETDNERDRAAAAEGRAILGHLDRRHARQLQTLERVNWAGMCGVSFTKLYWDPQAMAQVPLLGMDGTMSGRVSAPVGDVCEEVVPPFEVYLDPSAKRWRDVQWLIHACVKPLSWFQERFGERGFLVEPDARDASSGYVDGFLHEGYGGISANPVTRWFTGKENKAAVCYELWERPTPR